MIQWAVTNEYQNGETKYMIEKLLLLALSVLLTALLTSIITRRNKDREQFINSKQIAACRLRDALSPELTKLQHPEEYGIAEIPHILKTAYERHQTAVNEFRFFLEGSELDRFNNAWRKYDDYPDFNEYIGLPATAKKNIQKAIDRIEAIRNFTKDK